MHIQRLARPTEFRQVVVRQRLPEHARREVIPRRRPEERAAVALHNAVVVTCNQTNVSLALSPIDTSTSWVGAYVGASRAARANRQSCQSI